MEKLLEAITARDVQAVINRIFTNIHGKPAIRSGFRRESELWDFKAGLPGLRAECDPAWAEIAADVAALHNANGGVLFFGIADDLAFVGTRDVIDGKRFNDKIRRYLGDTFWVEFSREYIQADQTYLGVALVPSKSLVPLRMRREAPARDGKAPLFGRNDLAVREGDSTRIYRGSDADKYLSVNRLPSPDARYLVNDSSAKILRPDWTEFIEREELCQKLIDGISDQRTYVITLSGLGGIGKTALACWGVLGAYRDKRFEYIVSVSAKDREMTPTGIRPVQPTLSSYDDLLNEIACIFGFQEITRDTTASREEFLRDVMTGADLLLFVDNLETVSDARVASFLETLPKPVKAITTSRIDLVRTAAFPIAVGPLTQNEAARFFDSYAKRQVRLELLNASSAEKQRIVESCSGVPLAVQWLIGNSRTVSHALTLAETLSRFGRKGEELLEFCFRRVHVGLSDRGRAVLSALTLTPLPQPLEALSVACEFDLDVIESALEELKAASLVEAVWDDLRRDLAVRCLPITQRFAYRQLQQTSGEEYRMRQRLSDWYEGKDVDDEQRRKLVVAARQGKVEPDIALVDAAIMYRRQGLTDEADRYFRQAIDRNPNSWRAHREYAELLRDQKQIGAALDHYALAAANAPSKGEDRAVIFREWGMLLRRSGLPRSLDESIEKFEVAKKETPNDPYLLHALAHSHVKKGAYRRAAPLLEQLIASGSPETRSRSYHLLSKCYEELGDRLKLTQLRDREAEDHAAKAVRKRSKRTVLNTSRPLSNGVRLRTLDRSVNMKTSLRSARLNRKIKPARPAK